MPGRPLLSQQTAKFTDDGAQVLPRRNHSPAANRMEPDRNCFFRKQRWRVFRDDCVRVIYPQNEIRRPFSRTLPVCASDLANRKFVSSQSVFGAEVPRANTVGAAENSRHLFRRYWRQIASVL